MRFGLRLSARDGFPFDAVCIGEGSLDTLSVVPQIPTPGEKVRARSVTRLAGGQAATAAVAISRLGFRSRYIGAVGDDEAGSELRQSLVAEGVDAPVAPLAGVPTRTALVLVDENTGERSVIEHRDPRLALAADAVADDVVASARIMLLDGTDIALSTRAAALARERGIRTIIDLDAASPEATALLSLMDVVILPGRLVTELGGSSEIGRALASLELTLPSAAVVVATLGSEGALARCQGEEMKGPPHVVKPVDTTGAGDAFRAGFAAAWLASPDHNPDLRYLLDTAAIVAALNCQRLGAQRGLPDWNDVESARRSRV